MQKITPFLWYNNRAEEDVKFYTTLFSNSKINFTTRYNEASAKASGQENGSVMTLSFLLNGQEFVSINGGPYFTFTPAISLFVNCSTEQETDELWKKLSQGGTILMELKNYPFSQKFGWLQDKFGLSWQINFAGSEQMIIPFLMFNGNQYARAEEAINFYTSLFNNSGIDNLIRYPSDNQSAGSVMHAAFKFNGQQFMAIDSNFEHNFTFTEAFSFVVNCDSQDEIDFFWNKLSEGGDENAQQCGWLKDKYGVSWQIVPSLLGKLLNNTDAAKAKSVMQVVLKMKKLDLNILLEAAR